MKENIPAKFRSVFRSRDASEEELSPSSGFHCTSSGNFILSDDFNHRIQIYDANHNLIKSFGCKGKNPGEFHYPRGIAVDREENIYVADSWNHRIQKFDAEGNHLLSIGSCGEEHGQLNEPWDIFIAPNANILVVERYNHRIQIFSPAGKSHGWIGGRGTVLEEQLASIFETPPVFFTTPAFEFPTSIASDSYGNYFISDSGNHRILKFDAQWNLLLTFGERGEKTGQFEYPLSVSAGPNDLLYVADLNNDRIQVFTSTGQTLYELKEAENSLPLTAPSLTAIAPDGILYVGLTFDTRVISFQIPPESKKDAPITEKDENPLSPCQEAVRQLIAKSAGPECDENDESIEVAPLLQLSRLAVHAEDDLNDSLLLQGLDIFSRHLDTHRQKVISAYEEWQEAAVLHNQLLFAEQKQVLDQLDDPSVFNKSLFHAETRDKTGFRNLRLYFYEYRQAVEQGMEYFGNIINANLPEPALQPCLDFAEGQLARLGAQMIRLLETREQNEKIMMESFAETQAQEGQWETFLLRSNSNVRIMDVLKQFHFEIRSLLASIKGATLKFPRHTDIEITLNRQFIQPQGSEKYLKILLGFQEEGKHHQSLEILLKDLIDHWMIRWGTHALISPVDLTLADLQPVSFDAENLTLKQMSEPLLTEGMPLRKKDAGLSCGHLHFSAASTVSDEEDFIKNLWALWENQQVYETKYLEILQQLETLSRQQQELEAKTHQVNPQDKQSPITLQNNLSVVKFQVSILRRMALTMEINEANNLFRLAIGAGLLIRSKKNRTAPETSRLFKELNSFHRNLEESIDQDLRERKTLAFESSRLNGILISGSENKNIDELNQILEVKDQVFTLQTTQEKLNTVLNRKFKILNRVKKLLEFEKTCEPKNASDQGGFSTLPCQFSFANSGPRTRNLCQPYGIAKTPDDDIVVADYENHQVIRFSSLGIYKNHFGGFGNAPGFFKYPVNVQVDRQGFIYVADEKNTRIQKFTGAGKFLLSFGDHESEGQRLGAIFSLSIDREDQIWVADPAYNRIQIYASDGEWVRSLESRGNPAQDLYEPVSIHCQENGNYLIGDKSSCLLKLFDSEGKLNHELKKEGLGFGEIYFIASHPDHGIFASDYWSNRILHLNAQLDVVSILNHPGQRAGQFGKVGGLVLMEDQLIVADFENFRVQVLNVPPLRRDS